MLFIFFEQQTVILEQLKLGLISIAAKTTVYTFDAYF